MLPSSSHRGAEDAAESLATSAPAVALNAIDALSVSELRAGMQQFLRSSGALGSLKTQLRSVIVSELLKRRGPSQKSSAVRHTRDAEHEEDEVEDDGWTQRLADALVEGHLRHTGRSFSLAIFSSEADVSFGSSGDDALAGMLHLNTSVALRRRTSLLHSVLEIYLRQMGDKRGQPPGYAVGTQTDMCEKELSPPPLELRLAAVDAKYALSFSRLRESTREEVDRRMAVYREELRVQMEQGYQQRLRAFEQQQLNEARRAAEEHYGVLLQHKMEEMRELERVSVQRIEAERARLGQARDDLEIQRVELERRHRDLHGLLEERDKAIAATEGRLHDAKQQISLLTTQLRKYEELCGVRLAEADAARDREWRRVEDLRRLQAEHLAELQLKDEEISRLRFRLKSILANHGVTSWREEAGEEGGREQANTIREAFTRANAFQERVSAAYHVPSQQKQQASETWHSTWQPTVLPELEKAVAVDVKSHSTEPQVVPQFKTCVSASHQEQQEEEQQQPQEQKKEEVKETIAPFSPPNTTLVATVAEPVKTATDSTSPHHQLVGMTVSSQEFGGKEGNGEGERKYSVGEEHSSSGSCKKGGKVVAVMKGTSSSSSFSCANPKQSRDSAISDDLKIQSASSSSPNSSVHSSSLKSAPVGNQASIITATAATAPPIEEGRDALYEEEKRGRTVVEADEDTARRGIVWAFKAQHTVLLQRQTAERKERYDDGGGRGTSSLDTYIAQARQRQQATESIMITRDSDDDVDSDILFGKRESSEESF
ncbi:hypothetical protein C3747_14g228 [Trypanosoma cruzi]|uniref:LisH domain-containing protein n=2 Tax=Trypanosoma cruzi TaxID=5693 RepID=Q4DZ88_TRYCC|nr:hypothetical protein, conserved [Trypanosoma cruzi]EAN97859.1 hypothetical protein, conserved [Trypanosoma cruzi]PWV18296.1 hypothetical protein C3747_14g228 [Trypanosoma cruzi]|eukprot:XP_819710.1 hypothetical protein [Trypanosoma cruzi strain CL Brener]